VRENETERTRDRDAANPSRAENSDELTPEFESNATEFSRIARDEMYLLGDLGSLKLHVGRPEGLHDLDA
jgi:hypothetical protein